MHHDDRSELEQSEAQFRLLVQGVTDYAIYMLTPEGRVSSWNSGAERIKGYPPDEIIGRHFSQFYSDDDQAAGMPALSLQIAARDGRFEKEGWRVRKDGTSFLAHVVIDAIHNDDGVLIGFAKVTRDITERQKAHESVQHAQHLIFQSQKLESIGQLTGGIAHDFNNLLTVVISSLELLKERVQGDAKNMALVQTALHGAERGATLTQRMLAYARRQDLTIASVDLPELIRGMMDLMVRAIGPEIRIEYDIPTHLPLIQADANQLESAILNLVVNARDAMPDGGVIVVRATEAAPENCSDVTQMGNQVILSITDTGQGMDAEILARAREPFFTTKGVGKGTGLGLSMVHGLAEQFGGTTRITSVPGHGTTVSIVLPVAKGEYVLKPVPTTSRASPAETVRKARRVLLVDDDFLVLQSGAALLEAHDFEVTQASSGIDALKSITQQPFDAVITDQLMPEMTGLQLARAIEALYPDMPIVLASGFADIPQGLPAKVCRLAKPFRGAELLNSIAEAIARHDQRASS